MSHICIAGFDFLRHFLDFCTAGIRVIDLPHLGKILVTLVISRNLVQSGQVSMSVAVTDSAASTAASAHYDS